MTIRVVTDSTADLPQDVAAEHGIAVVPDYIKMGGRSYLDGVELSREEFYERLPDCETPTTTSAPSPGAFVEAYERLAGEGATEVLSIHISANLSAVLNVAHSAAQATDVVPVTVFDSRQLTLGTGFMALAAAKAAAAGKSMAEILTSLEKMVLRTYSFAALDTLEFLHRGGRMNQIQYGVGSLLRIKPLLRMYNGDMTMERVRTRRRATERLVALAEELNPFEELALVHAHAPERAEDLWKRLRPFSPREDDPLCVEVTPVIGAHVGPGSVGLVCVSEGERRDR